MRYGAQWAFYVLGGALFGLGLAIFMALSLKPEHHHEHYERRTCLPAYRLWEPNQEDIIT